MTLEQAVATPTGEDRVDGHVNKLINDRDAERVDQRQGKARHRCRLELLLAPPQVPLMELSIELLLVPSPEPSPEPSLVPPLVPLPELF